LPNYHISDLVTYSNYSKIATDIEKNLSITQEIEITVEKAIINTTLKALLRELKQKYSSKLIFSDELKSVINYNTEVKNFENRASGKSNVLENIGTLVMGSWSNIIMFCAIVVDMIHYSITGIFDRKFIMKNDFTKNSYNIGYKAIPIVFLLAFLIGLTITLQAAIQMAKFGGQGYLAKLISLAMLKELGPLITAIIISGRTGSSIAAEIGTMVVMEEVDAIKTMGIRPLKFLLVPKFWAFTIAMPILTLLADIAGIIGGMVIALVYDVPSGSFLSEVITSLNMSDIVWGTIKSLSFAWTILAVASFKGLKVRGSADAVGTATTSSVVISIFMVVVIDSIFSLILYL